MSHLDSPNGRTAGSGAANFLKLFFSDIRNVCVFYFLNLPLRQATRELQGICFSHRRLPLKTVLAGLGITLGSATLTATGADLNIIAIKCDILCTELVSYSWPARPEVGNVERSFQTTPSLRCSVLRNRVSGLQ